MNEVLLDLYHRLPAPLRSLAATARGMQLRQWRYGPETEQLVQEALEREHWTAARWRSWQEERLTMTLHRAATRVPYYRELWATRRRHGDRRSWAYLENWPLLEKETLRRHPTAFVADDCYTRRMFYEHTSGTTGKPLSLWWSRTTVRQWYALFEARCRRWHNVSREDRWAILGGQLVTAAAARRPPFWVWNAALRQLYMSSYHLASGHVPFYLDALKQYGIKYLLGYSSSLHILADAVNRLGRDDVRMTVVITNAEPLFQHQRRAISAAFRCPTRETYGMAEAVAAASECDAARLHSWPEVGWTEVTHAQDGEDPDRPGEFVCTGLLNTDMPLIRYRVGDRGALAQAAECACGRALPSIESLEGRTDDLLYTSDGRAVGRLDPVFKDKLPIQEAQIIQDGLDRIRVRYVRGAGFSTQTATLLVSRLKARLGEVQVMLEEVDTIPRDRSGKFRAVVSRLTPEDKELLQARHSTGVAIRG